MRISPITSYTSNLSSKNNRLNHSNNQQKVAFGYGDYGPEININPDDDCAEQKQTLWEGIKGAFVVLALPVTIPLSFIKDVKENKTPQYYDMQALKSIYEPDDFDEHFSPEECDRQLSELLDDDDF